MLFNEAALLPNSRQRHTGPRCEDWTPTIHSVVEFLLSLGRTVYVDSLSKIVQNGLRGCVRYLGGYRDCLVRDV